MGSNIACAINFNYVCRIAATLHTVGTWFVCSIQLSGPCIKVKVITNNNNNNNNNNKFCTGF
jgi:hypothetical protein